MVIYVIDEILTNPYVYRGILGACGQALRAFLGLKKAIDDNQPVSLKRLFSSLIYGGISGVVIGFIAPDPSAAFFGGLASTDLTETILGFASGKYKKKEETKTTTT